jgi:hypothetical protein
MKDLGKHTKKYLENSYSYILNQFPNQGNQPTNELKRKNGKITLPKLNLRIIT